MQLMVQYMNYEVKDVNIECADEIMNCISKKKATICDDIITNIYIWSHYYNLKYIKTQTGLVWLYTPPFETFTTAPICAPENVKENFELAVTYFHEVLGKKLVMFVVDENFLNMADLPSDKFEITEERSYFDYLYDAESLRTLSGKKYHKKKNHVNAFLKEYEGRYEARMLGFDAMDDIMACVRRWHDRKESEDPYHREDQELKGLQYLLEECRSLPYQMFGVYVDETLEAFSLGTYDEDTETAFIHIEKANPEIRGLYPFVNQQFLCHAFPEAKRVNREDDMGLEGLRKAKLSYHPIELVKKYTIIEK